MRTRVCTGVRKVESELDRDQGARGVTDDMRPLDIEAAHEEPAVLGMVGEADRASPPLPPNPARW